MLRTRFGHFAQIAAGQDQFSVAHRDIAGGGELIGHVLYPVGMAENLVNQEYDRSLVPRFRIDDKRFDGAAVLFHGHPPAMPGRLVNLLASPVLRRQSAGDTTTEVL